MNNKKKCDVKFYIENTIRCPSWIQLADHRIVNLPIDTIEIWREIQPCTNNKIENGIFCKLMSNFETNVAERIYMSAKSTEWISVHAKKHIIDEINSQL